MIDISLSAILPELVSNPTLAVVIILSVGTLLMNGAHDASNAIATAVATRSMSPGKALAMAAVANFLGVLLMTFVSTAVAKTVFNIVNFGGDSHMALVALAAAMVAITAWGGLTWFFGLPSSQSHALIAALTGAAIALQGGISGVNPHEWMKVIYGLIVATIMGFGLGWLVTKLLGKLCANLDYRRSQTVFGKLLGVVAGIMAFLHGAQDGQKFMSIAVLGMVLALGYDQSVDFTFPLWVMILCSASMCIGTAVGGRKIIKTVGMDIVKLEKWQGFAATFASSVCILISDLTGLPISTTHTCTTAIMGVGTAKRRSAVNWNSAKNMVWAWVLTFPGCGLVGFVLSMIFMKLL